MNEIQYSKLISVAITIFYSIEIFVLIYRDNFKIELNPTHLNKLNFHIGKKFFFVLNWIWSLVIKFVFKSKHENGLNCVFHYIQWFRTCENLQNKHNANIFTISLFCAVDSISNASFNFHFENKDTCSSFNCKFLRAECLCEKNCLHIMHVCWICSIFWDRIGKYLQGSLRLDHNYSKVIRYIGNK